MTSLALDLQLVKGAIEILDPRTSKTTTIAFQYNPESMSRDVTPAQLEREEAGPQFKGAPKETFKLSVIIDADGLSAKLDGILPELATLETLIYPQSKDVKKTADQQKKGNVEVVTGYDAPLILFAWGPKRVVPVTITSLKIEEEAFNRLLNPIRAKVTLGLEALNYDQVHQKEKAHQLFLTYQKNKEELASKRTKRKSNQVVDFAVAKLRR
ncbi:MAG: hypothetical protein PVF74_00120 [Anaerolineales bacterium]|jgi:hypothetical protein